MAVRYYKLFDLLNRRGMKKTDLLKIISSKTIAKLSKGEYLSGEIIEKICFFLGCQPGDIMEIVDSLERTKGTGTETELTQELNEYGETETYTRDVIIDEEEYQTHQERVNELRFKIENAQEEEMKKKYMDEYYNLLFPKN